MEYLPKQWRRGGIFTKIKWEKGEQGEEKKVYE